ncbi:Ig-like domain-containing protein [Vibrio cholerae]|uniref:Ig-like domain-containing protein n=1 Tax=Vibrio cholerae TaxID=666 RepID=UPI00155EED77|nr:Ig-like domain-containing protein [Vibrio cholerae]NOF32725.1 hypothetical protein [Vibrio cholerae]
MKVSRLLLLIVFISSLVLLGCNSDVTDSTGTPATVKLERLVISPFPVTINGSSQLVLPKGKSQPIETVGFYSDGSFRLLSNLSVGDWYSSAPEVASFDRSGVIKAKAVGRTVVYVNKDGIHSNELEIRVSDSFIVSLVPSANELILPAGVASRIRITGFYNDNTTSDETESVSWDIENNDLVRVNANGLIVGINPGETWLVASKDSVQSTRIMVKITDAILSSIRVSPESITLAKGQKHPLVVTGYYSDSSEMPITDFLSFDIDPNYIGISTNPINVLGKSPGNSSFTVKFGDVTSNPVSVHTTEAVITSIDFVSVFDYVLKGLTQQLSLLATFSDGTELDVTQDASYSVNDEITAAVSSTGLVQGKAVGDATIQASITDTVSGESIVTSIAITVCDLAGTCLDVYDIGDGMLFTSSPSKPYLDRDNIYPSVQELEVKSELGFTGPVGQFYQFNLTQAMRLCDAYSTSLVGNRGNWRLPTIDELESLWNKQGNMFVSRGWSVRSSHWSDSQINGGYQSFNLQVGIIYNDDANFKNYASCVSTP